jgi:CubicO group peptidase (beta-lactamase class C family)
MMHTHFHDDYTEIVPNRSYSYQMDRKDHYTNDILSYSNAGATSLFTNIDDMSKWVMNFWDHKVGDHQDIARLTQRGRLNSGKELNYALGIGVDSFRGQPRYQHGGADAGYRTFVSVVPGLRMGFIVFSNLGDANTGYEADQLAALFIKEPPTKKLPDPTDWGDSSMANLGSPQTATCWSATGMTRPGCSATVPCISSFPKTASTNTGPAITAICGNTIQPRNPTRSY